MLPTIAFAIRPPLKPAFLPPQNNTTYKWQQNQNGQEHNQKDNKSFFKGRKGYQKRKHNQRYMQEIHEDDVEEDEEKEGVGKSETTFNEN